MTETDTPSLPAAKTAYSYDATTREYLGPVEVFLSPLEGRYFLPRHVVEITPPADLPPRTRARLTADGAAWEVVPDYRRGMLWDTATATPVPNTLALGEALPEGVTAEPPPILGSDVPLTNVWDDDAHAWRQLPDYSRTPVWCKDSGQRAPSPAPREPLPDTLTTIAPPPVGAHQALKWNAAHDGWDLVPAPAGESDSEVTPPTPSEA